MWWLINFPQSPIRPKFIILSPKFQSPSKSVLRKFLILHFENFDPSFDDSSFIIIIHYENLCHRVFHQNYFSLIPKSSQKSVISLEGCWNFTKAVKKNFSCRYYFWYFCTQTHERFQFRIKIVRCNSINPNFLSYFQKPKFTIWWNW